MRGAYGRTGVGNQLITVFKIPDTGMYQISLSERKHKGDTHWHHTQTFFYGRRVFGQCFVGKN